MYGQEGGVRVGERGGGEETPHQRLAELVNVTICHTPQTPNQHRAIHAKVFTITLKSIVIANLLLVPVSCFFISTSITSIL